MEITITVNDRVLPARIWRPYRKGELWMAQEGHVAVAGASAHGETKAAALAQLVTFLERRTEILAAQGKEPIFLQ